MIGKVTKNLADKPDADIFFLHLILNFIAKVYFIIL